MYIHTYIHIFIHSYIHVHITNKVLLFKQDCYLVSPLDHPSSERWLLPVSSSLPQAVLLTSLFPPIVLL